MFLFLPSVFFSQGKGGVETPGIYEYNVKDCFANAKYKGGIKRDSVKSNTIFKSQRIWRTISLENKENRSSIGSSNKCTEIGLFEIIKFGIFDKQLNVFLSDNFNDAEKERLTEVQIRKRIRIIDSSENVVFDSQGNETTEKHKENRYMQNSDIKTYLLKEDWYISSKSGNLEKKIIAIAPMTLDKKSEKVAPLFWLYYNEWKELLDLFEAKNIKDEKRISYAYALQNQYFISRVSKESNVYGRAVKETKHGTDAEIESEVIKGRIDNSESDLYQK